MNQRLKSNNSNDLSTTSADSSSGILDEKVLYLVSQSINWDPHTLCLMACVCRKVRAVAKRVLWRELCISRAPRMVEGMAPANGRLNGGWDSLAKILFYCCGGKPSPNFQVEQVLKGHFASASRFSKTSGQSFLTKKCQTDVLYICDPCEHNSTGNISAAGGSGGVDGGAGTDDDLGVFRGVFKGFVKSKTRECLIKRKIQFEDHIQCPYCKSRVWSMTLAKLVPTKSALKKLGSVDGSRLEYFVCVHGHLHGTCWLTRLSSDDDDDQEDEHVGSSSTGKTSSGGEEVCETVICL
ncbi:hypothetical protein MKX03_002681 [Papaver bracteatum]|nr:hypothetical protein MKX03_002681 [Papaver bracteatum]